MSIADVLSESVDAIRGYSSEQYTQEENYVLLRVTTIMDCLRRYFDSDNPLATEEIEEARTNLLDALQIDLAHVATASDDLENAIDAARKRKGTT